MDIQNILSNLIMLVTLGMMIGLVSKTMCDGLLAAWGIEASLITRILVFIVNCFLVVEVAYFEFKNLYVNLVFLLLLVCSGAEACYQIINDLKKLKDDAITEAETEEQDIVEEYESDEDDEIVAEGTEGDE